MFALVHLYDRDKVEEIGLESVAETSLRAGLGSGILLHRVYCRLVFKFTMASPIIVFLKSCTLRNLFILTHSALYNFCVCCSLQDNFIFGNSLCSAENVIYSIETCLDKY